MAETDEPYETGKNKPPLNRRFKKGGPSPHPEGRPKGSKNRHAIIRKVLEKEVKSDLGGKKRNIAVTEAAVMRLVQKALTGDRASIQDVLRLWAEVEEAAEKARDTQYPFSDADREVIAEIHTRMKACEELPGRE